MRLSAGDRTFPDVQAALTQQVTVDCVLDGELVVWTGERLEFDALQERMVNTAATVRRSLVRAHPASFVAFDVLAVDSVDVRPMRWTARRTRLESLAKAWVPPLQLSPVTSDVDEAREWLDVFKGAGVEGLVVKGASTRYQPGRREWLKVNSVGVRGARLIHPRRILRGQEAARRSMVVRNRCRGRGDGAVTPCGR
jgi:ATP-dependent DNA ligase